ncbi:MAG: extracellular solute-binding protein [Clostridia bacterium]|nr:extracellular solute-binding protein [Clostridia bacterium]
MKRRLLATTLALLLGCAASASAVTLRTVSSFAGTDAAAMAYVELLREFEDNTGNVVEDSSGSSDESWKAGVLSDFAAGDEPDILFFFACSADSAPILRKMVPVAEINAAYPGLNLPESDILREADGVVYAIPVRPFYEGLFVNTDLFERCGAPLPDTWEHLEQAVGIFNAAGIVPIAASLSDIPHYVAECAVLAASDAEAFSARPGTLDEVPESWLRGMALVRRLYELDAFPGDALNTSETITSQLFRDKRAAMQIDGSWFGNSIYAENMDTTAVMPVPALDGVDGGGIIGGVSMGFYLTRRAWDDPNCRDAAVALLAWLTRQDNLARLGTEQISGALARSAEEMLSGAKALYKPIQDDMNRDARERWLLECVPAVASGEMTPEDCWRSVMELEPFSD